jgi:hypothetical protein
MQWLMAHYANAEARALGLGIHFQTIVPLSLVAGTGVGEVGAQHHAQSKGLTPEAFWSSYSAPLTAQQVGEHVVAILSDPAHLGGVAFGLKGDTGITSLDAKI